MPLRKFLYGRWGCPPVVLQYSQKEMIRMKLLPTMAGVPHVHSHYRKRKEVPAAEKAPGGQIRRQSAQIHRIFQGKLRPITEIPPEPGGIYFGKRAGSHRQVLLGKVVVKFAYRPLRNDGALLEDYKILGYPLGELYVLLHQNNAEIHLP